LMDKLKFIREFFKHWREVGSVIPSSRWLVGKMLALIDFEEARVIVELGPGTGCLTRKLLARMSARSKLLVFEINPDFCRELKKIKDGRLSVFNVSALALGDYFRGTKADYVLSGLPLTNLDRKTRTALLEAVRSVLHPPGAYIQFQYSLSARKELQSVFNQVSIKFTLLNIPPAFVYQCKSHDYLR